jgi:hypothetical protein
MVARRHALNNKRKTFIGRVSAGSAAAIKWTHYDLMHVLAHHDAIARLIHVLLLSDKM